MEHTLAQIKTGASHSFPSVNAHINASGNIIGQGITASNHALGVCGGKLDEIYRSFGGEIEGGGIEGGSTKDKSAAVIHKVRDMAQRLMVSNLDEKIKALGATIDASSDSDLTEACEEELKVLERIKLRNDEANSIASDSEAAAASIVGLGDDKRGAAAAATLAFSSVNALGALGAGVGADHVPKFKAFLTTCKASGKEVAALKKVYGVSGGMDSSGRAHTLADRLLTSRSQLRESINEFIKEFGAEINGLVAGTNLLATQLGKSIEYTDDTTVFLDTFTRLSEYLNANKGKIYQDLLELNVDRIDSQEIKDRFMSSIRDVANRADALGKHESTREIAQVCRHINETINRHADRIKTNRDAVKNNTHASGSAEADMERTNELFSVDASKININGMVNPLENLKIAIHKIQFFRNIAMLRSNLQDTGKELATYSKDYEKSVGAAIGEAITKIKNEYTDIINQVSDNKAGMGLEIDMYNESAPKDKKISKEKLKLIYKWQCDARVGLYKTVEAIDLYLLHFTNAVSKNPDAVADLHKLLSATRIIAKWYDVKAGDNIIRFFESFGAKGDDVLDSGDFVDNTYLSNPNDFADLSTLLSGEKATRVYERCRRAVEGIVVLKNIISYFVSIGEKYGELRQEKSIYMSPSSIYKNLVNYLWVSAIDINMSGTEILTNTNELKRAVTYEDTKIRLAKAGVFDPDTMGINFNKHSIDKLRILKCRNELEQLSILGTNEVDSQKNPSSMRVMQLIRGVFARLGKTQYIFQMLVLGVYDLSLMNEELLMRFFTYLNKLTSITLNGTPLTTANIRSQVAAIVGTPPDQRNATYRFSVAPAGSTASRFKFIPLNELDERLHEISAFTDGRMSADLAGERNFITGFFEGWTKASDANKKNTALGFMRGEQMIRALRHIMLSMIDECNNVIKSSTFTIDDTYFVLVIKALAGKIMAITGVNALFHNPHASNKAITMNQTRLILGGARGEGEVIDDAVELYVRLPLMVEFYRIIFENGNKEYKSDVSTKAEDEEQISYVPEIGNVFSGLIINIFDKSKHIQNGIYTARNMSKIVSEVNSIYRHYKDQVPGDRVVRHIIMELVAEINRRYGVVKRQELLQYYRAVEATRRNAITAEESNYTNNDFDILDEANEFDAKSPSDDFIKLQESIKDPSASKEVKINKLTNYKILKNFRESVDTTIAVAEDDLRVNGTDSPFLSIIDRVRMLKKLIHTRKTNEEKYDLIIKAIEESDSMNQASDDIFLCFHEFVITPLRTAFHMYKALDMFILNMFACLNTSMSRTGLTSGLVNEIMTQPTKGGTARHTAIANLLKSRYQHLISTGDTLAVGGGIAKIDSLGHISDAADPTAAPEKGLIQSILIKTMLKFSANSGNLVKMKVSTTDRITMDFSEYQRVCEYLLADVKFMIDKFTGLVPTELINTMTNPSTESSVYWLEDKLVNGFFNKLDKRDVDQGIMSLDTINSIMPIASDIIFKNSYSAPKLFSYEIIQKNGAAGPTNSKNAFPIIRDTFAEYSKTSRLFVTEEAGATGASVVASTSISNLLFNPDANASLNNGRSGIVQEFNTLIANYFNDMYDAQSRKIYTKAFATFAGNALVDAMNGQSFVDFGHTSSAFVRHFALPKGQIVLSSTLAYVMKIMSNRVNPVTGMKVHELTTLQEVSPHVMERYRAVIPMYIRMFRSFITRCRAYRKILGRIDNFTDIASIPKTTVAGVNPGETDVRDNTADSYVKFAKPFAAIDATASSTDIKDITAAYLDEIVNGMTSLLEDATSIQTEMLESDPTVSLFFDVKKDFTKNYMNSTKELPFAPISTLTIGLNRFNDGITAVHSNRDIAGNKFLYGLRSMIQDDFKISTKKIPYLKKMLDDFNGYAVASNTIPEDKFDSTLSHMGEALNYLYDLRFYNGSAVAGSDVLAIRKKQVYAYPSMPAKKFGPAVFIGRGVEGGASLEASMGPSYVAAVPPMVPVVDASGMAFARPTSAVAARSSSAAAVLTKENSEKIINQVITEMIDQVETFDQVMTGMIDQVEAVNQVMTGMIDQLEAKTALDAVASVMGKISPRPLAGSPESASLPAALRRLSAGELTEVKKMAAVELRDLSAVAKSRGVATSSPTGPPPAGPSSSPYSSSLGSYSDSGIRTFQEVFSKESSISIIESVNVLESRNKITKHTKQYGVAGLGSYRSSSSSNPRARVIMVNILDLNMMPINVHSLMREIPLANLYNYAMTFDAIVESETNIAMGQRALLKSPYQKIVPQPGAICLADGKVLYSTAPGAANNVRFVSDVLIDRCLKNSRVGSSVAAKAIQDRCDSKLFHNLVFLTGVQHAIKTKVKRELEYISSAVVTNTTAVSNKITNALDSEDVFLL